MAAQSTPGFGGKSGSQSNLRKTESAQSNHAYAKQALQEANKKLQNQVNAKKNEEDGDSHVQNINLIRNEAISKHLKRELRLRSAQLR